jgi:hypothetical protein
MMSRSKCPQCGLVNFALATRCKRCNFNLAEPAEPEADISSLLAIVSSVSAQDPAKLATEDPGLLQVVATDEQQEALPQLPEFIDEAAPYTLGMIFFFVTLGLSIALLVYQLKEYFGLYGGEEWKFMTNQQSDVYIPLLEPLYYFEWIIKIAILLCSVLPIFPFLQKSYAFLKLVRAFLFANLVYLLLDTWAGLQLERILRGKQLGKAFAPFVDHLDWYLYLSGIAIFLTFIWFRYFTTSERVQKTFIN